MKHYRPNLTLSTLILCCALSLPGHAAPTTDNSLLLKQSRSLQTEASSLLTDLYLTEHSILFPVNDLVMVMFSQIQGARIFLHYAEFYIDDELIETFKFPMEKVELLAHYRAVQPMFITLLPSGEHVIKVRIYGLALGGNRFVEAEKVIHKGDKPLFLKLDNQFRHIEVTEW